MNETSEVQFVLRHQRDRMLAAGLPLWDLENVGPEHLDSWSHWFSYWFELGRRYRCVGEASLDAGRRVTAASEWILSAQCFHFAQMMLYDNLAEKHLAAAEKASVLDRALPLLRPAGERFSVRSRRFEGENVPIARFANRESRSPVVILIPGLEGSKEEMYSWGEVFLERGISVVMFDGPGQGELSSVEMTPANYLESVSRVIEALQSSARVDPNCIGLMGVSLGGYLASMVAAQTPSVAAVAEIGGMFDTASLWPDATNTLKRGFSYVTHSESDSETVQKLQGWTMDQLAESISCPFLIVHGTQDKIVPVDHAIMFAAAVSHSNTVLYPCGNHVCHNIRHVTRPLVADWFAEAFNSAGGAPT
jgi:2,6-dihydroxypseudooxynicotine hydrolase